MSDGWPCKVCGRDLDDHSSERLRKCADQMGEHRFGEVPDAR